MVICFGDAAAEAPVPSVAHVVVEHRYDVDAVLLAEDATDLLSQAFAVGVKASAELRRHVGVEVEIPVLVCLPDELEVGAGVDYPFDVVFDGRDHHVVVAASADVESEFAIFSENGKVDDRVATFCRRDDCVDVVRTDLAEVAFEPVARGIDVSEDDVVPVFQRLDDPRSQHSASA